MERFGAGSCAICLRNFSSSAGDNKDGNATNCANPSKLSCGHVIGRQCMLTALHNRGVNPACPFCRQYPTVLDRCAAASYYENSLACEISVPSQQAIDCWYETVREMDDNLCIHSRSHKDILNMAISRSMMHAETQGIYKRRDCLESVQTTSLQDISRIVLGMKTAAGLWFDEEERAVFETFVEVWVAKMKASHRVERE